MSLSRIERNAVRPHKPSNTELAAKATALWRRVKYDTTTITYEGNGWFNQIDRSLMGPGVDWGRKNKTPGFKHRRKDIEDSIRRLEARIEREAREAQMALSRLQQDLQGYAEGKLYHLIKDVTQSFEIAGRQRDALSCMIAMFLKAAAMIVVQVYGTSAEDRRKFLEACAMVFDKEAQDPNPNLMKGD